jgi:hypothetical protein
MTPEAIGTVILAIIAGMGLIGGGIAWFYKRGGQERESSLALRDNTKAITDLTVEMRTFMLRTEQKQDETDKRGADHETRLSLAERDIRQLTKAANNVP